jgi:hypothetical protein
MAMEFDNILTYDVLTVLHSFQIYSTYHIDLMFLLLCLNQTFFHLVPVNHSPNGLDILRPTILSIQIVRVLPNINAQQGYQPGCSVQWILIRTRGNFQTACPKTKQEMKMFN